MNGIVCIEGPKGNSKPGRIRWNLLCKIASDKNRFVSIYVMEGNTNLSMIQWNFLMHIY